MLVAGSWESNGNGGHAVPGGGEVYVVLFDGVSVPTETVHPGLLKCHAPGESALQCSGIRLIVCFSGGKHFATQFSGPRKILPMDSVKLIISLIDIVFGEFYYCP